MTGTLKDGVGPEWLWWEATVGPEWLWWEVAPCSSVVSGLFLGRFSVLCDPPGLTVEWTEDSLQQGQRISVPQCIYEEGCVKDVDEGLEVNADPGGPGDRAFSSWWWQRKPSNL